MTEFIFRGKERGGRWIYGSFLPRAPEALKDLDDDGGFIQVYNPESWELETFLVYRKTVGLWTGKTDRNGFGIFPGDLIRHQGAVYQVQYLPDMTRFAAARPNGTFEPAALADCEVIGNIYDNPVLWEAET